MKYDDDGIDLSDESLFEPTVTKGFKIVIRNTKDSLDFHYMNCMFETFASAKHEFDMLCLDYVKKDKIPYSISITKIEVRKLKNPISFE